MHKIFFTLILFSSLFLCNFKVEAFKDVYIPGENTFVEGNSWSAVVSDNTVYMPDMIVKVKGFNDTTYTLTVTWEKQFDTTYENNYVNDKKKKTKKVMYGNIIVPNQNSVTSNRFKWKVTKIVKNGVQIDNDNNNFYEKLFTALTGYNIDGSIDKVNFSLGVQEYIADFKERYPNYDGYGNLSYYYNRENIVSIFTIHSKINKKIIGRVLGSTNRYYPYINESSSEDTLMHDYLFAKNNSGEWKIQQVNSIYSRDGSWAGLTNCGYGLSDENARALAVKLDTAKAGLGL